MPYQTKSIENIDVVYLKRSLTSSKHGMPSCAHSSLGPTSHWRFYLGSRDVQLFTPVAMLNSFLKTRPFSAQNTSIQRITVNPPCVTMHTLEGQLKTLKIHVDMHCLDSDLLAVKFWEPGMVSHQESQHGTMSSWQACIHAWICNRNNMSILSVWNILYTYLVKSVASVSKNTLK